MLPPLSLNKHELTHHYRNNVFKKDIFREIYSNEKNLGYAAPPSLNKHKPTCHPPYLQRCRTIYWSMDRFSGENWASLSCQSSIVCSSSESFGTLNSFLSSSLLSGLIFPWSCACWHSPWERLCADSTLCLGNTVPLQSLSSVVVSGPQEELWLRYQVMLLSYFLWNSSSLNCNFFPVKWKELS